MSASSFRIMPGTCFALVTEAEHADLLEKARRVSILDRGFGTAEICGLSNYGLEGDETSLKVVFPTQRDAISVLDVIKDARNIHGDRVVRPWDRDRVDISKAEHADLLASRDEVIRLESELDRANERCRQLEKRAEQADRTASELRSAEFEWKDTIPVDEINGKRILVQVRGTEGGIKRLKAFIAREEHGSSKLHESLLAAEAKLAALEAEQAEVLASIAGCEALPNDATTYTVSCGDATMTVTGSPSGVANVVKVAYGGFEYGVSA